MSLRAPARPPAEKLVRLPDGRALAYAEYGHRQGRPIFYFHGWPGSRLEARFLETLTAGFPVRVIAIDRPGMGLSDPHGGRRISDWPADVEAVADALGLDRFAVAGLSGGGPYAAACAWKLPERLTAVGIVSGMGPVDAPDATRGMIWINRLLIAVGRHLPWLLPALLTGTARRVRRDPDRAVDRIARHLPRVDRRTLARPEMRQILVDTFREAFRQGLRGVTQDGLLYTRPWGFRLEEITAQVQLWHGEADINVPPALGRRVAASIPNCRPTFLPGEGHFSLVANHSGEILETLLSGR